jgi:hypothetical protein
MVKVVLKYWLVFGVALSGAAEVGAQGVELESCQYRSQRMDSQGRSVPPGLDEPLTCDHNCFYDELGLMAIGSDLPSLHDLYSIGFRLVSIIPADYENNMVWTVYLEREADEVINDCEKVYASKLPSSN